MKKILSVLLILTLCFAMFAGCSKPADTNDANKANEEKQATGKVINPLPVTIDVANLDNCTVAVSLEEGDAYVDDAGAMQMNLKVYTYDLYDMVDIAELEVGDSMMRLGEAVEIKEIERLDTGLIMLNGGQEKGGFDLYSNDSTVYYEMGFNDVKSYYELGEVTIPVSTEFVYTDSSDLDNGPVEYYPGDFLTEDAGILYDFTPNNTEVVVENGKIIAMNKYYTP